MKRGKKTSIFRVCELHELFVKIFLVLFLCYYCLWRASLPSYAYYCDNKIALATLRANGARRDPFCRDFPYVWANAKIYNNTKRLLKKVITLLELHNQEYTMIGGALLGLIRHNCSFVPWDDDVDLFVRPFSHSLLPGLIRHNSSRSRRLKI